MIKLFVLMCNRKRIYELSFDVFKTCSCSSRLT